MCRILQPSLILFLCSGQVDRKALQALFDEHDLDGSGTITVNELETMLVKLGVAPVVDANGNMPEA